jgi:hypothetical protein
MILSRRWAFRTGLATAALALVGLMIGAWGLKASRAAGQVEAGRDIPRQVTVFAVIATPGGKSVDSKLTTVQPQLNRLLPDHGFKLLDVQSTGIVSGESVESRLGHGYTAETTLIRPIDEDGKVQLLCELSLDGELQFSATVRAPLNQLFFCERPFLTDGSKLLIGVGAR